ncbi:hypothetical protein EBU71_11595 [bacterium]|nr:hypothetical protein [Candidatus Elulimicrobium humile]
MSKRRKSSIKEFFEKNNIKPITTGDGTGVYTGSILDANTASNAQALEVKFQTKLQDIAQRIQKVDKEAEELKKTSDFLIQRTAIKRPVGIGNRTALVSKKIKDTVDGHKLNHKCDIAYVLLERFRQLDKEGKKPLSQFLLKDLNIPYTWELGTWCMKLNVRPAEAVRYICEGMTRTQERKIQHWTERTQSIEGFADPETIALIELVDVYDSEIKANPKLSMKEFYRSKYEAWFKKHMSKEKTPSYNSFSEWFKWARKRAVNIREIHKVMQKYQGSQNIQFQSVGKKLREEENPSK